MWHSHAVDWYLAIKWNEGLIPARTRMDLANIVLSERSQTQKDKRCMIPLI